MKETKSSQKQHSSLNLGEAAFKLATLLIENDAHRRNTHGEVNDEFIELSSGNGKTIKAVVMTDHHFLPNGPDVLTPEVSEVRRHRNAIASHIISRSILPNTIRISQSHLVKAFSNVRDQISMYLSERRRKLEPTPYILFNYSVIKRDTEQGVDTFGQYLVATTYDDNNKPRYLAMRLYMYHF